MEQPKLSSVTTPQHSSISGKNTYTSLLHSTISSKGFKLASVNVNSLLKHIDEIRLMLIDSPLEVLAINESKLDDSIFDGEIHIPGYNCIRNDRNRAGGGDILYVKDHLSYTLRNDLVPCTLEMACIELHLPHCRSFLVCSWYRPPNSDMTIFNDYDQFLDKCDSEDKEIIIMGDLNCDVSKTPLENHTRELAFVSSMYHLEQLINEPTRTTISSATTIDLIFTNRKENIASSGVIQIGMSDHNLIFCVRKFIPPKSRPVIKEVRNFKNFVAEEFVADLNKVNWENVRNFDSPNDAWQFWRFSFESILNAHAPIRHKRLRAQTVPWLNSKIKRTIWNRDYHKKRAVKYGSDRHWELYKSYRNSVNIEMRKAKSAYFRGKIDECSTEKDSKKTWKLINSLLGRQNKGNRVNELNIDDHIITDSKEMSEAFNDFFINIGPNLASELDDTQSTNNINTFLDKCNSQTIFKFSKIPVENVLLELKALNISKSTGLDGIPAKLLKIASEIIAPSLTHIFNLSLSTGTFVDEWKIARVSPLFKSDDRRQVGNYRPISILPIVSKVFEKEVFRQLYGHLIENSILSKYQSGFRPCHSTVTALIQMCDNWFANMDKGLLTGVVFIDIRKAFDAVNHSILLDKLKRYGLSEVEITWFNSYLTNRKQQCLVNGHLSEPKEIICGVPQGSILGPLLFLIYINDLPNCLTNTTPCMFADDMQVYVSAPDMSCLVDYINPDLARINDWLNVNKLRSHKAKTKHIVIGSSYNLKNKAPNEQNDIIMDNCQVSRVEKHKCLGVQIDEKLSFDSHIDGICKKASASIGALKRMKPFVPFDSLKATYSALVQPYFDYCSPLWDTCGKTLRNRLQRLQSRAARVITGADYDIRSADILADLDWVTLDKRRAKLKSVLMFKILNHQSAPYLNESFNKLQNCNKKYELRNTETDLALPKPKTNFLKRSFRYSGAMLWNNLPDEAKRAKTLRQFKRGICSLFS